MLLTVVSLRLYGASWVVLLPACYCIKLHRHQGILDCGLAGHVIAIRLVGQIYTHYTQDQYQCCMHPLGLASMWRYQLKSVAASHLSGHGLTGQ